MTGTNNRSRDIFITYRDIWVCLFIVTATLAVYWQVNGYDFVELDDNLYFTDNQYVQNGFTVKGITWSFTNTDAGMWIPLVWLSYMAGSQVYGVSPGWHHMTNVFLHLSNILLLFFLLKKITNGFWQSASVAALFALHPLHVESVVWITERKDVLSMFFFLLTIWGYCRYVQQPKATRYLITMMFYTLGLMAKPMLVTVPFVMILMDFWPLERLTFGLSGHQSRSNLRLFYFVLEKIPFFVLASITSIITFTATQKVVNVDSFVGRIANASVFYVMYIVKMIWPTKLAVLYPHPGIVPWWKVIGAASLLATISLFVIRNRRRQPYLIVGWLWFLGTLVPVIGIVQAGTQCMADRFAYLPFIGLYICIAWGFPKLLMRWRYRKMWLALFAMVLVSTLMAMTWKQAGYWKNSVTLFEHALEFTAQNWLLHNNLGIALMKQQRSDQAIDHYLEALRIKPDYADAHFNLGNALEKQGQTDQSIEHYLEALRIQPDYVDAHYNFGNVLARQGRLDEAIVHYLNVLRIQPDYTNIHNNMGIVLARKGNIEGAISHFREELRIKPDSHQARSNLKRALMIKKSVGE